MAISSESSVTSVIRTWTFMIIFCFAGCVAGSCLSYGHSCWGAHGKRSGEHNLVPFQAMNQMEQEVPSLTKEQLLLSRLISRPLLSNKERRNRFLKIISNVPEYWSSGVLTTHIMNNQQIRDRNKNDYVREGGRKRMSNTQDAMESINNEKKDAPEILLISPNEASERDNKPLNIELFKVLSDINGNFE